MANANNYAAAGRAASNKFVQILNAQAENKVRYDKIAEAAVTQDAMNRANTAKNNARIANRKIASETDILIEKERAKRDKDIRGINKQARMTGMLAGGAALLGGGIALMNKKDEPDERLSLVQQQAEYWRNRYKQAGIDIEEADARYTSLTEQLEKSGNSLNSGGSNSSGSKSQSNSSTGQNSNSSQSSGSGQYAGLQGGAKTLADAIARYESGDWGYEAFNQGGAASGRKVLGKSGSYKELMGGRSLTDLTLGEIFDKQNTKAKGMSMEEHIKSGGLHAVGRYQFIGSTLQDEVSRMGLSLDTKFTPQIQDKIFLNHIKRVGDISPWVGPSDNYSESEKANFRNIIQGL